ncbi:MAG: hypothetical protein ACSLFB_12065 [Acidimicrobiales bacterium]
MTMTRKGLLTGAVVLLVGTLTGFGTFSAFTSTTRNDANTITAGSVTLTDDDAATPMFNVGAYNGAVMDKCIRVDYDGTLPATGQLYLEDPVVTLGQYVLLTITKGTQTVNPGATHDCTLGTGFTPHATDSAVYGPLFPTAGDAGTLGDFQNDHFDDTNGLAITPDDGAWSDTTNFVVYRFRTEITDNAAQSLSTGLHDWVWKATAS